MRDDAVREVAATFQHLQSRLDRATVGDDIFRVDEAVQRARNLVSWRFVTARQNPDKFA